MKKFFYLLFSTIILISCGNGAKAKTEAQSMEEKQPDHIEVLYFHGAQRCITCRAIETNIVALLDSLYSKEQADDRIIYKVIDISKKENGQNCRQVRSYLVVPVCEWLERWKRKCKQHDRVQFFQCKKITGQI